MEASEDYTVLFDQYLKGELTKTEVTEFEDRLGSDEDFMKQFSLHKETLEGIELHFDQELKSKLQAVEYEVSQQPTSSGFGIWWRVAAVISIVLVSILWFYNQQGGTDEAFQAFYKPYPNIVNPSSRGLNDESDSWSAAYNTGNYMLAMSAIEKELQQKPGNLDLLFYHGQSALATNQLSQASRQFQAVINRDSSRYTGPAIWYLSLIELKQGDIDSAKDYLDRLIFGHPDYKSKAEELYEVVK